MKVKFRTVLLVFLFIKLCILFTVLQETMESLSAGDHPLLYGTDDLRLFDQFLIIICSISIFISLLVIIFHACGHSRYRKPYVIGAFVINLIIVAPFFYSGIYLAFKDPRGLSLRPKIGNGFAAVKNYTVLRKNVRIFNSKANRKKFEELSSKLISIYETVEHVEKRYCCCGLTGGSYYTFVKNTKGDVPSTPINSRLSIRCPRFSLFKNSSCVDSHLHGCESRLKSVHPTRILIYSLIGAAVSTIFLIIIPFFYSEFEMDRRRARAAYIRRWRRALEQRVMEHRMMRNSKPMMSLASVASKTSNASSAAVESKGTVKEKTAKEPNQNKNSSRTS